MLMLDETNNQYYQVPAVETYTGAVQQEATKNSNPIIENIGAAKNKNDSTDYTQTPLLSSTVFIKD